MLDAPEAVHSPLYDASSAGVTGMHHAASSTDASRARTSPTLAYPTYRTYPTHSTYPDLLDLPQVGAQEPPRV